MSDSSKSAKRRLKTAEDLSSLRKSALTRTAILDTAFRYLEKRPFRDLTIGLLMAQAGASRPAFYQYFVDLHEVMEILLAELQEEVVAATSPWLAQKGDPVKLLKQGLRGLVDVCEERGAILRAVSDAAPSDERLEKMWEDFLRSFDDAVTARIQQDQAIGIIPPFDARPVAHALNRMDAAVLIARFGQTPKAPKEEVLSALTHCWVSALYPLPGYDAASGEPSAKASSENTERLPPDT
ncbi:TetR/AcrR family transcriptional regulator [Roseobacter ponti]|uniref:TetR/AcrR family transcriptional regulator n=1 Tax=Roseobacter ponti TaxID=1891787 RepID=A0A858SPA5_9RHOB|nr:TetR/AcrR family transcriptional regulator [Roseobacter ponti]QJF50614.1 TetR/AcrR family transcriptional regulator [Roseobacter ponti]